MGMRARCIARRVPTRLNRPARRAAGALDILNLGTVAILERVTVTHFNFVPASIAGIANPPATAGARRVLRVWPGCLAALAGGLLITGAARAQPENIGTTRQPLVAGTLVDRETQREFGLLTLFAPSGSCSASMLNDYWAITAAHCIKAADGVT